MKKFIKPQGQLRQNSKFQTLLGHRSKTYVMFEIVATPLRGRACTSWPLHARELELSTISWFVSLLEPQILNILTES